MLRNDENTNVRLAALEALRRFPNDPVVREELLSAMSETLPDVVRFELIETLVRANEKRVLPYLEDIIDTETLPQPVRDAAEMASFKLI
jgi:HEAT repeat protein